VRRALLVALLTLAVATAVAAGAFLASRGGEEAEGGPASPRAAAVPRLDDCLNELTPDDARACYGRTFTVLVNRARDPREAIRRISEAAWADGGFLLANCHGLMHPVGREYARRHAVTLASLMEFLPRSNDPGCAAGFAHGLVTGVAPQLDLRDPAKAAAVCDEAGTRYRRYSCVHGFGHAFMRVSDERLGPALQLCRALGAEAPDCAQGAFHDYWFAVLGKDGVAAPAGAETDPRTLCSGQAEEFVRPCWYRAFVDNRPAGLQVSSPAEVQELCRGLTGVWRSGCVTAASVIGPPDPAQQLILCAGLPAADAPDCVRGTKVQNILGAPTSTYLVLIGGCERFSGSVRTDCYRWLGKVISVVTDAAFGKEGCPQLAAPGAREACEAGARATDEPLVTFS
jgi:hypothetical protein